MKKNTSLKPLEVLVGKWNVTMSHVDLPEPLSWQDSIDWLEDGFIIWHWQGKNEVPQGTFIIGRNENESGDLYSMLYYDARGISRLLHMSFENKIWKFSRIDPEFSQRFEGLISEDGKVITGRGYASDDKGKTWRLDYEITYTKINEN